MYQLKVGSLQVRKNDIDHASPQSRPDEILTEAVSDITPLLSRVCANRSSDRIRLYTDANV